MTTVRAAEARDVDALRVVYQRASLSNDGDQRLLRAHPELLELDPRGVHEGRTVVATDDDVVVGFATLALADGFVEMEALFVDPDHRRAGHAMRLVEVVVDTARRAGLERIEVTANDHARAFYEAAGFVQVGMAPTEYAPAPRMHLALD